MKREADALRTHVRELVDELFEEGTPMPANQFFVTHHNGNVVSLRLFLRGAGEEVARPMNISVQEACELAAWLVVAASLGEQMNHEEAHAYFERAFRDALNS